MNVTPTSGPITSSITHQDREATSSRHSFSTSQRQAGLRAARFGAPSTLRERKEDLFEVVAGRGAARRGDRGELLQRAFAADAPAAQEHEAIADASRIRDLVD